ncbi:MAG: alpha/beta hydrolase [Metallosphaera sp.]
MKLTMANVSINYEVKGEGDPIVLIHHLAGSIESWEKLIVPLSSKHRVIAYDLRGHGNSSVPASPYLISDHTSDLISLLEYLSVKDPVIIGHSIGSLIAIDFSLKKSVKKVVLIGALYKAPDKFSYMRYVDVAVRFGMEGLAYHRRIRGELPSKITDDFENWNRFVRLYRKTSVKGYVNSVYGLLAAPNYEEELSKIEEVVLIYGSNDGLRLNKDVFTRSTKVKYHEIQGAGHFLNLEESEKLLELLNQL